MKSAACTAVKCLRLRRIPYHDNVKSVNKQFTVVNCVHNCTNHDIACMNVKH